MKIEPHDHVFEAAWQSLRKLGAGGDFEFGDPDTRFSAAVNTHFEGSGSSRRHGVYVVHTRCMP